MTTLKEHGSGDHERSLRERRHRLGFTAARLAAEAEVSVSVLTLLESGYRPRRSLALVRIENALTALESERTTGGEA